MPMIGHEVECKKYLCLLGEVQRYFLYDKEDLVTLMRENAFLYTSNFYIEIRLSFYKLSNVDISRIYRLYRHFLFRKIVA